MFTGFALNLHRNFSQTMKGRKIFSFVRSQQQQYENFTNNLYFNPIEKVENALNILTEKSLLWNDLNKFQFFRTYAF